MNKLKRYIIFLIGLFINSLGVSLITKANLGTSPISSIPYVLSLNFPLTLGNFTIIFSLLLIFLQLLILRKNFKPEYYLQIPVSILFGYFIDFTMILMAFVQPESYPSKIIYLLIGCVILGFGVYIEVLADVVMLPGESFVRAIVQTWNREFGSTKVCFDVSMAVIAAVLSFVLAHRLDGVREGTVIAALLVGFIARQFGKALTFVKPLLFPEDYAKSAEEESSGKNAQQPISLNTPLLLPSADSTAAVEANSDRFWPTSLAIIFMIRMSKKNLTEKEAKNLILKEERRRADNYHYYTRQIWGAPANYHLSLDTSLGYDYVMDVILETAKRLK